MHIRRKRRVLRLAAAAILALLLVAGVVAATRYLLERQALLEAWSLPPPGAADSFDWQRVIERGAFRTHERLRRSLVNNTVTPAALVGFRAVVHEAERLHRVEKLLERLDGSQREQAVLELYAELMLAEPRADILHGYLRRLISRKLKEADAHPDRRAPYYAWVISYASYASIKAYEGTGQERFLELVARTFEAMLPHRDSVGGRVDECRDRVMQGWGSETYTSGKYTTNVTAAGRITYPAACFCRLVLREPRLKERFGARAERFLEVIERVMADYEADLTALSGTEQCYYRIVCPPTIEPLNHMLSAGCTFLVLHETTAKPEYLQRATCLAEYYKESMYLDENNCLVWAYDPTPENRGGRRREFVWKAQVTAHFARLAAEQGVVFTDEDLKQLCRTFLVNVFREKGSFNATIYHPFEPLDGYGGHRGGYVCLLTLLEFDAYCPRLREVLEDAVSRRPEIGGWFRRAQGAVGYAHRLASRYKEERG